jgi:hypothetical protein
MAAHDEAGLDAAKLGMETCEKVLSKSEEDGAHGNYFVRRRNGDTRPQVANFYMGVCFLLLIVLGHPFLVHIFLRHRLEAHGAPLIQKWHCCRDQLLCACGVATTCTHQIYRYAKIIQEKKDGLADTWVPDSCDHEPPEFSAHLTTLPKFTSTTTRAAPAARAAEARIASLPVLRAQVHFGTVGVMRPLHEKKSGYAVVVCKGESGGQPTISLVQVVSIESDGNMKLRWFKDRDSKGACKHLYYNDSEM